MQTEFSSVCRVMQLLGAGLFFLAISIPPAALAHGTVHQDESEISDHMAQMREVKEHIPEKYRTMTHAPMQSDAQSLQRGEELFMRHCRACHGEKGDGQGPAAAALQTPPANFLNKGHSAIYGPGEKFWIIGHGTGKTGMPPFSQLSEDDRWHLVNYILNLQQRNPDPQHEHFQHR